MFHSDPQVMLEVQRAHHQEARDSAYTQHLIRLARGPRLSIGARVIAWIERLGEWMSPRPGFVPADCLLQECV